MKWFDELTTLRLVIYLLIWMCSVVVFMAGINNSNSVYVPREYTAITIAEGDQCLEHELYVAYKYLMAGGIIVFCGMILKLFVWAVFDSCNEIKKTGCSPVICDRRGVVYFFVDFIFLGALAGWCSVVTYKYGNLTGDLIEVLAGPCNMGLLYSWIYYAALGGWAIVTLGILLLTIKYMPCVCTGGNVRDSQDPIHITVGPVRNYSIKSRTRHSV